MGVEGPRHLLIRVPAWPVRNIHPPSLRLYDLAQQALLSAVADTDPHPVYGRADVLTVIVMGVAAAEANVNELGAIFATKSNVGQELPASVVAMAAAIEQAEEDKAPTIVKYDAAAAALDVPLDPGRQPRQDGLAVATLRNAIVHVEPAVGREAIGGRWQRPKVVQDLIQLGRADDVDEGADEPEWWLDGVQTVAVSEWALGAVLMLMRHLTENLPTTGTDLDQLRHRWDRTLVSPRTTT